MTGKSVDPQIQALLNMLRQRGAPMLHTLSPAEGRRTRNAVFVEMGGTGEPVDQVTDMTIPGPAGPIPVRLYKPASEKPLPVLIYFHGGGWVICNLDTHDPACRALANRAKCAVVSVDYRLSPESKFPAAIEDSYAVTLWLAENGRQIGCDPKRIAVGGDSAGSNLATVVARKARDENGPRLVFQLLIYPVADLSTFDTDSYREHGSGYLLTTDSMVWYRNHYLSSEQERFDPNASPLLAEDLNGLPPALVQTAEFDVLKDEGEAYAKKLERAGTPTRYICYQGMIHAFFNMGGMVDGTWKAIDDAAEALRKAFNA